MNSSLIFIFICLFSYIFICLFSYIFICLFSYIFICLFSNFNCVLHNNIIITARMPKFSMVYLRTNFLIIPSLFSGWFLDALTIALFCCPARPMSGGVFHPVIITGWGPWQRGRRSSFCPVLEVLIRASFLQCVVRAPDWPRLPVGDEHCSRCST